MIIIVVDILLDISLVSITPSRFFNLLSESKVAVRRPSRYESVARLTSELDETHQGTRAKAQAGRAAKKKLIHIAVSFKFE